MDSLIFCDAHLPMTSSLLLSVISISVDHRSIHHKYCHIYNHLLSLNAATTRLLPIVKLLTSIYLPICLSISKINANADIRKCKYNITLSLPFSPSFTFFYSILYPLLFDSFLYIARAWNPIIKMRKSLRIKWECL